MKMAEEDDLESHQRVLQQTYRSLTSSLSDVIEDVVDHVFSKGGLTVAEKDVIDDISDNGRKARKFVNMLLRKPASAFLVFLDGLREVSAGHVAEELQSRWNALRARSAEAIPAAGVPLLAAPPATSPAAPPAVPPALPHAPDARAHHATAAAPETSSPHRVTLGEYHVAMTDANKLGEGGFGQVWKGYHTAKAKEVAVKRIAIQGPKHETVVDRELSLMQRLQHRNIVQAFYTEERCGCAYLVLEYCHDGNLNTFMKSIKIPKSWHVNFFRDAAEAVCYLHSKDILHRDIKPLNILVCRDKEAGFYLKLADLGLVMLLPAGSSSVGPITGTPNVGTRGWLAPELINEVDRATKYNRPADIFSLGLVYLAIAVHTPGKDLTPYAVATFYLGCWMKLKQDEGLPATLPTSLHEEGDDRITWQCKLLVEHMICADAAARYTIRQVRDSIRHIKESMLTKVASAVRTSRATPSPAAGTATPTAGTTTPTAGTATPSAGTATPTAGTATPTVGTVTPAAGTATPTVGTATPTAGTATPAAGTATPTAGTATPTAGTATSAAGTATLTAVPDVCAAAMTPPTAPPAASANGPVRVRVVDNITLPVSRQAASVRFGHRAFLVGFINSSKLHYYEFRCGHFRSVWKKALSPRFLHNCGKFLLEDGSIALCIPSEVAMFSGNLSLLKTLLSLGKLIHLAPGDNHALIATYSSQQSSVLLSVVPLSDLTATLRTLAPPSAGPYAAEEELHACIHRDGRMAVVSYGKPFIDFYDADGSHVCRTQLPAAGAGKPGSSPTHVLLPIDKQPKLCVLGWGGELLQTLGHEELGLQGFARSFGVSCVRDNCFSLWSAARVGEHHITTYEIHVATSGSNIT